jgi:N-hydroxyarylamine O-acetyltransferase
MARAAWIDAYLGLLGVPRQPPAHAALRRMVRGHLACVPFENVTTLLRLRDHWGGPPPDPDPEALVAQWIERRGGGLCYEVARTFRGLLAALGYDVRLVTGAITWPGSHEALIVELDGRQWLVDAGNGAPFFDPVPLGSLVEVHHAGLSYRFRPGERPGTHVQDRLIDGVWTPFCLFSDDPPPTGGDLRASFCRHHTPGEGKFVGELNVVRCHPGGLDRLHNRRLTRITSHGRTETDLDDAGLARAAAEVFQLPGLPVTEAVAVLRRLAVPI